MTRAIHMTAAPLALLLALGLAGACGPGFQQKTPAGFVELDDQERYDYRATTADGLVIGVRAIDHEPKGHIDFWVGAITNRMRERGGYALLGVEDVQAAGGLAGKQMRFGHDEGSRPHLYYVTVFVTDDTIYLMEAGGTKEQMEGQAAQIAEAVRGFQAD